MGGVAVMDEEWIRRHVAAFRFHRGHAACAVPGCTGSQPLMWVPTENEALEVACLEIQVERLAGRVQRALSGKAGAFSRGAEHIHWAR